MSIDIEKLRRYVIDDMDMSIDFDDEQLHEKIDEVMKNFLDYKFLPIDERVKIHRDIFDSIRGLGIIEELLDDEDITEIMINGENNIFVEKGGFVEKINKDLLSGERLEDIIQQIVARTNKRANETNPIVDTRLSDGSRVNIVLPPIALDGSVVTIRKFPKESIGIEDLISWGSITKEAAVFLKDLVIAGYNIFVSGGTGSGKTTFLNVLSNFIPSDERVITIEDSAELRLESISNLIRLESRQANSEGENGISIRDLIKTSLRMRPDRIIVGEVRGEEALDMLQAMNTGHDGSMSTGHANSSKDMLSRLETMVLTGIEMPLPAIRAQIASAIDIIVHLGRVRDKTRKVLEITEVVDYRENKIILEPLFQYKEDAEPGKKCKGMLFRTKKHLFNTQKLKSRGINDNII